MQIHVAERGERPSISTGARRNAPAGLKVLSSLLSQEDFADVGAMVLDWVGDLAWDNAAMGKPMPQELRLPSLYIEVQKRHPVRGWLKVSIVLDLEAVFGKDDYAVGSDFRLIVNDLRDKVQEEWAKAIIH